MTARLCHQGDPTISEGDPHYRLYLSAGIGLTRIEKGKSCGFVEAIQPAALGLAAETGKAVDAWCGRYVRFAKVLPYGYSPDDCAEFDIEGFNREACELAYAIVAQLDDRWILVIAPLQRTRRIHLSRLMDMVSGRVEPKKHEWGDGTPILGNTSDPDEALPGRWVRVAIQEYSAGIFDATGAENCMDGLPVDAAIAKRLGDALQELCRRWAEIDDVVDGPCDEPMYSADRALLAAEGLRLALDLKAALPDGWTVVYFDIEAAARRAWLPAFEYRV